MLKIDGETIENSGADPQTSNNRMEMMGAIKVLEEMPEGCQVTIVSDSQYVVKGVTEWRLDQKARMGRGIPNADLWKRLDKLNRKHKPVWRWVRGHNGNPGNERADELAGLARESLKS